MTIFWTIYFTGVVVFFIILCGVYIQKGEKEISLAGVFLIPFVWFLVVIAGLFEIISGKPR